MTALHQELETYRRNLSTLLNNEGQFVLVKGDKIVGVFETRQRGLEQGYKLFGLSGFMVKEIESVETVHFLPYAVL
jgi:hypothetical protein